jgi:hypothetical protein
MKNVPFFVFAIMLSILTIGCGKSGTLREPTGITVKIIYGNNEWSPGILISADSARLNYDTREIIISSPKAIGRCFNTRIDGSKIISWVALISIQDNKLVISMPEDGEYSVWIGDKYNLLPKRK